MTQRGKLLAGAFLMGSSACFVSLDISSQLAVGVGVVGAVSIWLAVFARYVFQAVSMAVVLLPTRGRAAFATAHPKFQIARGVLLTATTVVGINGLKYLPVAEFTAIVMLTPLLVSLLAVRFLGEVMRPVQWALLGLSFVGALVVARPSGAVFGWALLFPLGSLCFYSCFQLLTRKLALTEDPLVMHFYTGLVGTCLAALALPFVLQALNLRQLLTLTGVGVFGTVGHYLLIQAFRRAPASELAPFIYMQVPLAVLGGWLVFARVPDWVTGLGIALIVAGGVASALLTAAKPLQTASAEVPRGSVV
jgi:drug/metabolite transporter (DMT)-like permease